MMKIPDKCPECDSTLERVKDQLFCRNPECPAVSSKKLEHFCKIMKIKGLGPATIEETGLETIQDIYDLSSDSWTQILGPVRGPKIMAAVEASKNTDIATFLEALSISGISAGSARKLAAVVSSIDELTESTCSKAGLGSVATGNILKWLKLNYDKIRALPIRFSKVSKPVASAESKTVCITGKLKDYKNRTEAASVLSNAGYVVVDSVTKTTNYLVNESGEVSSKTKKAEQYKIPQVSIDFLLGENKL